MTARRWILLALCVIAGSVANVWRTAEWLNYVPPPEAVFQQRGASETGEAVGWAGPVWLGPPDAIVVPGYPWRPFRANVRLCATPESPADGMPASVRLNDAEIAQVVVPHACRTFTFELSPSSDRDPIFTFAPAFPPSRGVGVTSITLEPIFTIGGVLRHAVAGAIGGALIFFLLIVGPRSAEARSEAKKSEPAPAFARPSIARSLCMLLAIWSYLGLWAVLKPPLQAPDEVQHLMRATSVLKQPWVGRPDWIRQDERFVNPVALWPAKPLSDLFYRGDHQISREQVLDVRARSWTLEPWMAPVYTTALASYPNGYYGPIFVVGQLTTSALGLSPWQSIYAYRLWTIIAAGLLWLVVYRTLSILPETAPRAGWIVAFLLLIPTLAFASSAVTPDAVNIPLGALGVLLSYQVLMRGTHRGAATAALLACALTKPSGLLIFGSVIGATLIFWLWKAVRFDRAIEWIVHVARLIAVSFVIFYVWSPPRFYGGRPKTMGLTEYAIYLVARVPDIWLMFWGLLGWNDYQVRSRWYWLLAGPILLNLYFLFTKTSHGRSLALFCLLVLAGYLAQMAIGEYHYVTIAGLNFQGRHVLPACIGLCGLMMHDVPWARWLLFAYLAVLNVSLMNQSLIRYFGGDVMAWWASLP